QAAAVAREMDELEREAATLTAQRGQWEDTLKERRHALGALERAARDAEAQVEQSEASLAQAESALDEVRRALDARGAEEHKLELERTGGVGRRAVVVACVRSDRRMPLERLRYGLLRT